MWIRPVSTPTGGGLNDQQIRYTNKYGSYSVKVLQKIEMEFSAHAPLINQPENFLISHVPWLQRYKIDPSEIGQYLDYPYSLWGEGDNVIFDFIAKGEIKIEQSLQLVRVDGLRFYLNANNKRRASFFYNNIHYDLAVTDPFFHEYINGAKSPNGILCISLAGAWEGRCYKIVATIF
ncbi:hypothetical protein PAHA111176_11110 [Parendozoicomonas haliclonae]|uniref:Dual OB-containing domain-containing protein n=1 Tax=Parendozoicomonas haliclonae TaxID=1960125 RepID=A0A1X7ALE3_9GAMM|nr:hypothetical protein EHSB41UT_02725 [Parendozoicomonas haliclonae]